MKCINRVTFLGRLAGDPEFRVTKSGKNVASFSIATNSQWYDHDGVVQNSVDYHRVVAWESLADLVKKYLKKGFPVMLEGKLVHRSYEGKDKIKRYVTEVVMNSLNFFDKKIKSPTLVNSGKQLVAA